MDSLAFLSAKDAIGPLYVVHGDEAFLKRLVIQAIRERALGGDVDDQAYSTHAGETIAFADVFDELQTAPFFAPRRLVIVQDADAFVSNFRAQLERQVTNLPPTGTLVLDVRTWASNTRLAKIVPASATVVCKAPPAYKLPQWCSEWSASQHQKQLPNTAAALLVDLVGGDMGLLDQELQKLASYVGDRKKIEAADVDRLVGQSRSESVFKIFEAIADQRVPEALRILDRQFEQGEEPMKVLGAINSQVRKLAQAARLALGGTPLSAALAQAGVPPFAIAGSEKQLRHIGRHRAVKLYDKLLEINLAVRGESELPVKTLLERFLMEIAGAERQIR